MKVTFLLVVLLGLALSGCGVLGQAGLPGNAETSSQASPQAVTGIAAAYPDLGPAPELENTVWLNSDQPLRLKDLRGKVVLLEMWTFACINCQHVIPALSDWYRQYSDQGLVIIGNHFPEFAFESDLGNLQDALQRLGIAYPVAQDNNGQTWSAYHNRYWPTLYLIDKRGRIRYTHIGEGAYDATQKAIVALLNEPG